jgi:hypothetical protein
MMLKASAYFIVGAVARLEAMPGLSEALHLGLRLIAVVDGRALTPSTKLDLYAEGLARWADLVVTDAAGGKALTGLKPQLAARLHVSAELVSRCKAGDATVLHDLTTTTTLAAAAEGHPRFEKGAEKRRISR